MSLPICAMTAYGLAQAGTPLSLPYAAKHVPFPQNPFRNTSIVHPVILPYLNSFEKKLAKT